jgi:hypothetical protein
VLRQGQRSQPVGWSAEQTGRPGADASCATFHEMNVLDPSPIAAIIALAVALAAGVGVLRVWLSTAPARVRADAPTFDLRDETPALVDLLTGGFTVEDDAVPATAVDLAARGFYDLEEYGGNVVIRLRSARAGSTDDLLPYESRVLRHIASHAVDGVTPAAVLTIGADGVSTRWFTGFVREVTKDGRRRGLCRRRFDVKHLVMAWALVALALAPAWAVAGFSDRTNDPTAWGSIGNVMLGLALLCGFAVFFLAGKLSRSDAQADTPAGREAAAHWLGVRDHYRDSGRFEDKPAASVALWERHLAYATAMGLAPVVQRQLPFETEHDRHAWSRATGHWRRVKVRYQSFRPGWGQHPGKVALTGLIQAFVYGAIAYFALSVARSESQLDTLDDEQRRWVNLGATIIAIVAGLAAAYALLKVVIGVADLFPRRTIEGEVVRRRTFRTGHRLPKVLQWAMWSGRGQNGMRRDHQRRTRHHLAVDDGSDDRVLAREVRAEIAKQAPQGSRVRIRVSPLLGYVSNIEVLSPPARSAASEPGVAHPLVEETAAAAGAKVATGLDGALAHAASMTGEDGRSLLEQTDDEGVTLEQRLSEGRSQLDQLRRDPRVASSPLAGFLDALTGAMPDEPGSAPTDRPADGATQQ